MTQSAGPPDRRPNVSQIMDARRTLELSAAYLENEVEQLKLMESAQILKRFATSNTGALGHVKTVEAQVELNDGTLVYVHFRDGEIVEVTGVVRPVTDTQRKQAREIVEGLLAARSAAGLEAESLYVGDQLTRIKQAIRKQGPGRKPIDAIKDIEGIIEEVREWLQVPRRVR